MIRTVNARRSVTALVTVAALGALLTGCTLFAPPSGPSPLAQVKIDKLAVPDELRQQAPGSESSSILAPIGSLPAVAASAIQQPGRAPELTIWSATDGRTWTRSDYRSTAKGAVSSLISTASADLSVVGGSRWSNGVTTPFLISSTDRRSWSTVAMPESLAAGSQLQAVAVIGKRIVVITSRPGATAQGFVRVGSTWKTARLPKLPAGQKLNAVDLAGDAKRVLLLARPAKEGSPGAVLVFSSRDGGVTWPSSGAKVADDTATVAGMVEGASGWLITGALTASGAPASRPASWSSSDGSNWTAAALPQPSESASRWDDDSDATLGAPLAGADGSVAAVMRNTGSAYASVWTWGGAGSWTEVGQTGPNPSSGEGGSAFPVGDGVTGVVLGARDWLRGGSFAGGWAEGTVFAARSDFYNAYDSVTTVGTNVVVPLSRSTFTLRPNNSWTNSSDAKEATISAKGAVSISAAVPAQATGIGAPVYGSHGAATVMLGFTWDGVGPILATGFATADGSTWTAVTGFPADGATDPSSVARVGAGWIATASRRTGTDVGTPDHGSVFSSADGVTWVADAGDFGSGTLETGTYGCLRGARRDRDGRGLGRTVRRTLHPGGLAEEAGFLGAHRHRQGRICRGILRALRRRRIDAGGVRNPRRTLVPPLRGREGPLEHPFHRSGR